MTDERNQATKPITGLIVVVMRCPKCNSCNTRATSSHRIRKGLDHEGQTCKATKQHRRCEDCAHNFPVIKIGGPLPKPKGDRTKGVLPRE